MLTAMISLDIFSIGSGRFGVLEADLPRSVQGPENSLQFQQNSMQKIKSWSLLCRAFIALLIVTAAGKALRDWYLEALPACKEVLNIFHGVACIGALVHFVLKPMYAAFGIPTQKGACSNMVRSRPEGTFELARARPEANADEQGDQ